jgi:hypothetical protein
MAVPSVARCRCEISHLCSVSVIGFDLSSRSRLRPSSSSSAASRSTS